MKSILVLFVAMGSIVTLGDASCFFVFRKPGWPYKGCMMNGKLYPFGHIERTEDCHKCYCNKYGMECCTLYFSPGKFDREKCKAVFNKERCDYDVVQKDGASEMCSEIARVG